MNTASIVFLVVIAIIVLWVIFTYNRFVTLVNRVRESWADIDVQLKRRYDLIPNLVNSVKGYVAHERGTFEKVTEARTQAMNAGTVKEHGRSENMLTDALKSLFAVSENYPNLKANENFVELQKELADTENKIQAARRFYNTNVMDINTKVDSFPSNIISSMFRFGKSDFFELEEGESSARQPVSVNF